MRIYKRGLTVKVKRLTGPQVYQVPAELADGDVVTIVSFRPGYFQVEYNGREFTLPLACIEHGQAK